jgi:subtilisin family serine protease
VRRRDLLTGLAGAVAGRAADPASADAEIRRLCENARAGYAAAACSVATLDGGRLHYVMAVGAGAEAIIGTELPTTRGIGGFVAMTGQPLAIDEPVHDARFARDIAESTGYVPDSMLVLPILGATGDVLGILSVLDRRGGDADTWELDPAPAWSEPFLDAGPQAAPHLAMPGPASREWAYGDGRGSGVRVAVIDSGIEAAHPLVGGVDGAVEVEADGDVVVVERPHDDLYGHGTACAGLIRQLAPDALLWSVRVLGSNLRGNAGDFAAAVEWCIEARFDVVNLSLSTSNPEYLELFWELVDRAAFGRVLLVAAMNNVRTRTIPSELAGVCSVACGPGDDVEAVWCNPAGPPEWGAAGLGLEVAWRGGGRVIASGNSLSAAIVSGHLARIVGAHPRIAPWQARTVLAAVAVNAGDRRLA